MSDGRPAAVLTSFLMRARSPKKPPEPMRATSTFPCVHFTWCRRGGASERVSVSGSPAPRQSRAGKIGQEHAPGARLMTSTAIVFKITRCSLQLQVLQVLQVLQLLRLQSCRSIRLEAWSRPATHAAVRGGLYCWGTYFELTIVRQTVRSFAWSARCSAGSSRHEPRCLPPRIGQAAPEVDDSRWRWATPDDGAARVALNRLRASPDWMT